jgi:hypothetical protein
MNTISQKIGEAKDLLAELEREGKSKGRLLNHYIQDDEELVYATVYRFMIIKLCYF